MRKIYALFRHLFFLTLILGIGSDGIGQTTITQWTYEPLQGTNANPTPNTGSGTSSIVGSMTTPGTATGMSGTGCGAQVSGQTAWAIGTANPGTTNESSGVRFNVSTTGYNNIIVSWDQRMSNSATNTVRLQYTTDGTNWNNFTMTSGNTTFCLGSLNDGRFEAANATGDQFRRVTVDLSSITGVNNNSNFGVRLVAAHFQTTGQFRQINNNTLVATGGTWRFDNVTISGSAILPTVNLSVSSNAGTEAGATVITVTATSSSAVSGDQTVSLGVSGTNITAGDYSLSNTTITIPNGSTTGSVTFTVTDDAVAESIETAVLTISTPSSGIALGSTTVQNISITDNDVVIPTVNLSVSSNTATEANATTITVTATASTAVIGNQTVTIAVGGTGIDADDYVLSGATITIPDGLTTGTVTFVVINDAEIEGTETAGLTISNPSSGVTLGATTVQNVAIADNICQPLLRKSTATSSNGAEISAFDSITKRVFTVAGSAMEYYTLSNTGVLSAAINMPFGFTSAGNNILPNSVAVKNGIVAVSYAIQNSVTLAQEPGIVAFYNSSTAAYIGQVTVGYLPDMLVFTPDGNKILTANEGEPNSYGQGNSFDPEGSISIIDISGGVASATVQTAGFSSFNGQMAALKAAGVRIYGPGATVAQDLEPEYIAFSADGSTAYITLQENNAVAILDIATATVTEIKPLGLKNHNTAGNGMDASDRDLAPGFTSGAINIQNWPVFGMYMPDAIASFTVGGNTYFITANEGDSRSYTGYSEEIRVGAAGYVLDPTVFPNASTLKLNQNLGRLQLSNATGDTDIDGDFDEIHALGARSFSIWNSSFTQVYDCGNQLEQITSSIKPSRFNADNSGDASNTFDTRSDNKGPEIEAVTTGTINGVIYAFVGAERSGDIFVYDISNPNAPVFKQYIDSRLDFGVEGLLFIPANQSPTGKALVIASSEISRTVSVYEFNLVPGSLTPTNLTSAASQGSTNVYGDCTGIIAKVTQSGANPITGSVTSKVWIEPSVPLQAGKAFVQRHYEITPAVSATTATGTVTLYFTQAEFDNFNSNITSTLDLPTGPADATGISNLRVAKYPGVSGDGSGLPSSYTGQAVVIDPANSDIIWNSTDSRWEVSFEVSGFSGFIVQTSSTVLPVSLISFDAQTNSNNVQVKWKTDSEINHAFYEVLYSIDGRNFNTAGKVNPINGNGEKNYSFTHVDAGRINTKLYYRLKMVSTDGEVTYSNTVLVRFGVNTLRITDVYPNPTTGVVQIAASGISGNLIQVRITDVNGKQILAGRINANGTSVLNISNQSNGIYILEALLPDGSKQHYKLIKQ
jgi:Secretion system C-terminal sorting domain/Calx-beta domain